MKVLIADDEIMICEWLSFCVEKNPNCELVGIANNGEQAVKMFDQYKPDIVFLDIKMPILTGIDVLKIIKEKSNNTKVILLTAFKEFELAQEAIHLKADEYLLKTEMNMQLFNKIINKIVESENENYTLDNTNSIEFSIIKEFIKDEKELDLNKIKNLNNKFKDNSIFSIAIWKNKIFDFSLSNNIYISNLTGFDYNNSIYVFIGNISNKLNNEEKINLLNEYCNDLVLKNSCMLGVSSINDNISNIIDIINQSVYSLNKGFYTIEKKVLKSDIDSLKIKKIKDEVKNYYLNKTTYLYNLNIEQFVSSINEELEKIEKDKYFPILEIINFCINIMEISYIKFNGENNELMNNILKEYKSTIRKSTNFQQIKETVLKFIDNMTTHEEFNELNLSRNVKNAIKYIRNHYSEPISLEIVAEELNLNSEYLSRIFKYETKMTYTTFLTDIRLKKAALLLSQTQERVKNIAEAVGYPNVSYFSTIFKKKYGLNPYEFRIK